MVNAPKVTVVLPVHNDRANIVESVESLRNQALLDFEVVCVLNGSRDGSKAIVESIAENDKRFRLASIDHASAASARNKGLSLAKGKYVVFLDADDCFDPSFLELMSRALDTHGCDMAVCAADCFIDGNRFDTSPHIDLPRGMSEGLVDLSTERGPFLYGLGTMAWNKMYRRDFLNAEALYFQDLPHTNDAFFTLASMLICDSACLVDKALVHYRITEGSTQGRSAKAPLCSAVCAKSVLDYADNHADTLSERTLLYLNTRCAEFFMTSVTRAAASGVDLCEAREAFGAFAKRAGNNPGFFKVSARASLKYQLVRRCKTDQLSWVYEKRGNGRFASRVEKLEIAIRMIAAGLFGVGQRRDRERL